MLTLSDNTSISVLETRLRKAEKKLKSLNSEIEDIKSKILNIKQNSGPSNDDAQGYLISNE